MKQLNKSGDMMNFVEQDSKSSKIKLTRCMVSLLSKFQINAYRVIIEQIFKEAEKPKISSFAIKAKTSLRLQRFFSFCINLIFTYCLFVENKLVTIKHFLLN